MEQNWMEKVKLQQKIDVLEREFPGCDCGNAECRKICADALEIAKRLNINPEGLIKDTIRCEIAPKEHCIAFDGIFPGSRFTPVCRFGFVKPNLSATAFDDASNVEYIFHAGSSECNRCKSLNGRTVNLQQWRNESAMKRLGFWKQADGTYKPHPHCKCRWEKKPSTIDYSRYGWKKVKSGKLATYKTESLPGILKSIPCVLQKKLALQVGLEPAEFAKWAQHISMSYSNGKTVISADVPNIWICADFLRGGTLVWDRGIVNWGGTIGQAVSALGTWGMYEITCKNVVELKEAFYSNPKAVWGFVLYAHGSKSGYIGNITGAYQTTQHELMSWVDLQGFKLGRLYLMQCYSGANGSSSIVTTYAEIIAELRKSLSPKEFENILKCPRNELLKRYFHRIRQQHQKKMEKYKSVKVRNCFIKNDSIITTVYIQWQMEWGERVVGGKPNISYQGTNAVGIDWNFLEKIL